MRAPFLLSAAVLLLLGSSDVSNAADANSATWTVKKMAGNQWRNGNRLLAEYLGRAHTEIKALLNTMPQAFQEQYKELAERYADVVEARDKSTNPETIALHKEQLEHLTHQAKAMLSKMLGPIDERPQQSYQEGARGGLGDAVLDPLQHQLVLLQQRQQQQLQQLIQEMQQSQQEERLRLEQQLRLARQQHMTVQREGQAVRSLLVLVQSKLQDVQRLIGDLSSAGETIEGLTGRLEAALRRVSAAEAEGGLPLNNPQDLQVLDANVYLQTKASLGSMLGEVNAALQAIVQQIEQAEDRAQQLAGMGATGQQVSEQLLQICASFHVAVASQEEYLAEVVGHLENKQVQCDVTMEKLKAAIDAAFSRYAQTLKASAVDAKNEIATMAENLKTAVTSGAQQLKQQIEAEIQRIRGSSAPLTVAAQQLQQLQAIAGSWNANLDSSVANFDHLVAGGQKLVSNASSLPQNHAIDTAAVSAALQLAAEVKKLVRQEKARVQQHLRILDMQYAEALQQQQMQQQQGLLAFDAPLFGNADPYAAFALPTQLPRQGTFAQQQPQGLQPQTGFDPSLHMQMPRMLQQQPLQQQPLQQQPLQQQQRQMLGLPMNQGEKSQDLQTPGGLAKQTGVDHQQHAGGLHGPQDFQ